MIYGPQESRPTRLPLGLSAEAPLVDSRRFLLTPVGFLVDFSCSSHDSS